MGGWMNKRGSKYRNRAIAHKWVINSLLKLLPLFGGISPYSFPKGIHSQASY
jgi:hypothetical protein